MSKSKNGSAYLNPEWDEIQDALAAFPVPNDPVKTIRLVKCDDDQCRGAGSPGDPCPVCSFVLPNYQGGKVPVQVPASIKKSVTNPGQGSLYSGSGGSGYVGTDYGTGWQSSYKAEPAHDHDGDKVVFEYEGKSLFAANAKGLDEYSGAWNLIIDLARNVRWGDEFGFVRQKSAKKYDILRKYTYFPQAIKSEVLDLDWPDMSAPPCTLDFWIKLWSMLPEKTVAACIGGHGRTGTCLASLIIASGAMDYYDAIDHIREKHCHKAVETLSQEKYLHALYVEMIKRNIKHEKSALELKSLQEDLAWAELHVPNHHSSHGEPIPVKAEKAAPESTFDAKIKRKAADLKLVGETFYQQLCNNHTCKVEACTNPDHLVWVEYDPENDPTLWSV